MTKYRLIYSYYAGDFITYFHKVHLCLLQIFIKVFTSVDFIIIVNNINDNEYIDNLKNIISDYLQRDDINFIIRQNNIMYREGIIYKEFIVDKLNKYYDNELIFFAHTKGITNQLNLSNIENTKNWLSLMYWCNLSNLNIIDYEIINNDNICFGAIYNYDESNLTKNHWQYTGGFQWINPKRLYDIAKHNIDLTDFNIRVIAEEYLGNNVPVERVAFLNHEIFNKKHSLLLYENSNYPYNNIKYLAFSLMIPDKVVEYINFFNTLNLPNYEQ